MEIRNWKHKWTYAYGFYLPDHEHAKRQFFEYLQGNVISCYFHLYFAFQLLTFFSTGEAEAGLERLHQCAEKDLQAYLIAVGPSKDFNEFRTNLLVLQGA